MNKQRKRRLWAIALLFSSSLIAAFLVILALQNNINLFFTPTEVMQQKVPLGARVRVGGMVEKGSIVRGDQLQVQFRVTDFTHTLNIEYSGILPDLFREGQGVVALGYLDRNNTFQAKEILAKHDETYMPPEIRSIQSHQDQALDPSK